MSEELRPIEEMVGHAPNAPRGQRWLMYGVEHRRGWDCHCARRNVTCYTCGGVVHTQPYWGDSYLMCEECGAAESPAR